MKYLKLLILLGVVLVVLLIGVGIFADGLVKKAIETGGTRALGVQTTVEDVDVGLFRGTLSLSDLAVENPPGFGDGRFLTLGEGTVAVSLLSLLGEKIEIAEVTLRDIAIRLVKTAQGSNYETILSTLGGPVRGTPGGAPGGGSSEQQGAEEGKRFVIQRLLIENVRVTVQPSKELNLGEVMIPIDRIELKEVGSESDKGVLLSDLSAIVVESILKRASVSGMLPNIIKGALDGKLAGLTALEDAGIPGLQELFGGATTGGSGVQVNDLKKKLGQGLQGLGLGR